MDNTEVRYTELTEEDKALLQEVEDLDEEDIIEKDVVNNFDKITLFTPIFGDKYASMLYDVFFSSIVQRDELMNKFYTEIINDSEIPEQKKILAKQFVVAYQWATFKDKLSLPLIHFYTKKNPNLKKYTTGVRLTRELDFLQEFVNKVGFSINMNILPIAIKTIFSMAHYDTKDNSQALYLPIVCITRYFRGIEPKDYPNMWYVIMLIQNIIHVSMMTVEEIQENPDLIPVAENTTKFLLYIWKKSDPDSFTTQENLVLKSIEEKKTEESH